MVAPSFNTESFLLVGQAPFGYYYHYDIHFGRLTHNLDSSDHEISFILLDSPSKIGFDYFAYLFIQEARFSILTL